MAEHRADVDVEELVGDLTLEETTRLLHGAVDPDGEATGYVPPNDRLGIPDLRLVDGPMGVRVFGESATAFPASIALAAAFDPGLAERYGHALAREALAMGQDAVLGPGLNLIRVPHCGRNFEYYSEDPTVTARTAAAMVRGIEGEGAIATPKHYVANSQETRRAAVSAEVSERALRELYLPGFRAAVAAGAGSVMTAYNRVNGTHASDHRRLLADVLRGEFGFDGVAVSDWWGTESTVGAARAGLDLEMPGVRGEELFGDAVDPEDLPAGVDPGEAADRMAEAMAERGQPDPREAGLFGEPLRAAVERGDVDRATVDEKARRILRTMAEHGRFADPDRADRPTVDRGAHRDLAREVAVAGTVLLENNGTLPLADDADVALVGPNVGTAATGGGGSSDVDPVATVTPVEGLRARAGGEVTVAPGHPEIEEPDLFDALGGEGHADVADGPGREPAVEAAAGADAAVVFVRDRATEGEDRDDLRLPGDQDALVADVAAENDRTVVVANVSGPIETPWRGDVAAVLAAWYPGGEHGDAAAEVLYGDADPGGRLPVSFAPEDEYPIAAGRRFPGVDDEAHYDEGVFVGYRHFDAEGIDPTYPFGHGDSYATFEYGGVEAPERVASEAVLDGDLTVTATVRNAGERAGVETVQAYVEPVDPAIERPPRELAGYATLDLDAGEDRTVDLPLARDAVACYDEADGWTVPPGAYRIRVGRSSRDLRASATVAVE